MTTQAIARLEQQTADLDVFRLGSVLAKSGYFSDTREEAQAVVKVLYGREIGVGPIAAMMGINIIKGRPAVSAGLMASIIKASRRYTYRIRTHTATECAIEFFEGGESLGVSSFTLQDATDAGLMGNANWKNYPRNMLFARALSNGARWHCPDIFNGPVYTPDELDDRIMLDEDGAIVEAKRPTLAAIASDITPASGPMSEAEAIPVDHITGEQMTTIRDLGAAVGYSPADLDRLAKEGYRVGVRRLTQAQADDFIAMLDRMQEETDGV